MTTGAVTNVPPQMAPDATDEPDEISERVARGFEAIVGDAGPLPGAASGGVAGTALLGRVEALEYRVRQTMDRLTELVEAQLPEAVDGLRADLETLRLELQTSLTQANEAMAEERQQLRTQIATTVGAANRWFVRTRDQLIERLDHIAEVATETQAQAEVAAEAAIMAAAGAPEAAEPAQASFEEYDDEGDDDGDGAVAVEWDVEDLEPVPRPARTRAVVDVAIEAPELEALMDPLRGDVQELQLEVSSMGDALGQLRDEMTRLAQRIPPRGKGVRIDPAQIELIVDAVLSALPAPAPAKKAPAPAPAKAAKAAPPKKAPLKKVPLKQPPLAKAVAARKASNAGARKA